MLDMFSWIMENLVVYPAHMRENMERSYGLVFSQRVLLALVERGMPREAAYKLVQAHAMTAWNERRPFFDLLAADAAVLAALRTADNTADGAATDPVETLRELFNPEYYLRHLDASFERVGI